MTQNKKGTVILTLGFALFAMFFGAGNLILPPFIGLLTKENWVEAIAGFTITGILAPFLGILAVVQSGDSFTDLGKRVNLKVGLVLAAIIMLCIGPLVAIPRTGATTFEVAVLPIFQNATPIWTSLAFFSLVLFLSISPSKIVDIIGRYLTPFLLILLTILVLVGIFGPASEQTVSDFNAAEAFVMSFQEGYQTMDVLASVIFAGIIISAAKQRGYTTMKERTKVVVKSGLIAVSCLLFIYGGLIYLGATTDYDYTDSSSRTQLLLHIATSFLGKYGMFAVSISMALACLTTAIALTCAVGTFFSDLAKGKVSYKQVVVLSTLLSLVLSVNSVDAIIEYASSVLGFVYPIAFALILYVVIFGKWVKSKLPFVLALLVTAIVSSSNLFLFFGIGKKSIETIINMLPLADQNLEWVIPSVFGFFIGWVIISLKAKTSNLDQIKN